MPYLTFYLYIFVDLVKRAVLFLVSEILLLFCASNISLTGAKLLLPGRGAHASVLCTGGGQLCAVRAGHLRRLAQFH